MAVKTKSGKTIRLPASAILGLGSTAKPAPQGVPYDSGVAGYPKPTITLPTSAVEGLGSQAGATSVASQPGDPPWLVRTPDDPLGWKSVSAHLSGGGGEAAAGAGGPFIPGTTIPIDPGYVAGLAKITTDRDNRRAADIQQQLYADTDYATGGQRRDFQQNIDQANLAMSDNRAGLLQSSTHGQRTGIVDTGYANAATDAFNAYDRAKTGRTLDLGAADTDFNNAQSQLVADAIARRFAIDQNNPPPPTTTTTTATTPGTTASGAPSAPSAPTTGASSSPSPGPGPTGLYDPGAFPAPGTALPTGGVVPQSTLKLPTKIGPAPTPLKRVKSRPWSVTPAAGRY